MSTQATERADLHRTIWKAADKLRGQVDGWDFKAYILGMLFYRFLSESLVEFIDNEQQEAGDDWEGYSQLDRDDAETERAYYTHAKGYYILPEDLFKNVRDRATNDDNLNMTVKRALDNITASAVGTDSEDDFRGLFDDLDPNSGRLGNSVADRNRRLRDLLDAIGDLNLSHNGNTIDAFGDAYEYLMTMYASQAGRSGGEFFTPQEVSELVARLTVVGKTEINKVYDPACGSGSLLLKFDQVLGHGSVRQGYFGQEINTTTYNLCRINMFLHGIPYEKFDIACGDTLTNPLHGDDEPFQAIVSNPPYSIEWEGDSNAALIDDERFSPAGVLAPRSKADLAFTMHILSWLAEDGTAAIVEFPGVLYRSGAEQKIRKYLVDNNFVDAVIHLPGNIFFGTGIETAILVLKKAKADNSVLFVDARTQFVKSGSKNYLTAENQQAIVDAFTARTDVPHFAALIENEVICNSTNNYSLAITSYVEAADTREEVDAAELNARIARIVHEQGPMRDRADAIVADIEDGGQAVDVLVTEHCSDGVEWRTIGSVTSRASKIRWSTQAGAQLKYIDLSAVEPGTGRIGDLVEIDAESAPSRAQQVVRDGDVLFGTTRPTFMRACLIDAELDGQIASTGFCVVRPETSEINPKYLLYVLGTQRFREYVESLQQGGGYPAIRDADVRNFRIPVPPLPVQSAIVLALSAISSLHDSIREEEKARREQFEHYRDRLLALPEMGSEL